MRRPLPKPRIAISIEPEYLHWIDGKVAKKIFANRSHAIEFAIQHLMEEEEKARRQE